MKTRSKKIFKETKELQFRKIQKAYFKHLEEKNWLFKTFTKMVIHCLLVRKLKKLFLFTGIIFRAKKGFPCRLTVTGKKRF